MTEYRIVHRTSYEYEMPVLHAHHLARLKPRRLPYQRVAHAEVECEPQAHGVFDFTDYFGNHAQTIEVLERHESFELVATSLVDVSPRALSNQARLNVGSWDSVRAFLGSREAPLDAQEGVCDSPLVRAHSTFRSYAADCFAPGRPLVEAVTHLNQKVFEEFAYEPLATTVSTPLAQVMRERRGVCQDFAHVLLGCLRTFGLSGHYVSGYLETVPPPGVKKLVGVDASHAWVAVFVPDHGWLELDPTNGILPSDRHITLAWGRDFSDVSPVKGVVLGGGRHSVHVGVDVEPVRGAEPSASLPSVASASSPSVAETQGT
jgi:transglutaminase-like putative cysteine protease